MRAHADDASRGPSRATRAAIAPDGGSARLAALASLAGTALLAACSDRPARDASKPAATSAPAKEAAADRPELPRFVDVTVTTGIDFVHANGPTKERYLVETMGGGVCVLDYDGDGRQDLYFVDSGAVPKKTAEQAPGQSRLYRNLGGWRFEDVTSKAGLAGRGYAMGAVAGDYDADGDVDLYVTSYGSNALYRNEGDGAFRDFTKEAGVDDPRWSTGAAFLDYDRDGKLDLFVQNYVVYRVEEHRPYTIGSHPSYPVPDLFDPEGCSLFRNRGDGTFEDVTKASGIAPHRGKGLGVLTCDLDQDGDVDLYCSNDTTANLVFENRGDGTFAEVGLGSGAAYGSDGKELAGMGVDGADVDGDGLAEIVVTNFQDEANSIYRNEGRLAFTEVSERSGTATASRRTLGFGVRLLDFDNDGAQDLVVANGHIYDNAPVVDPPATYAQPALVFRGLGAGRFEDVGRFQPKELVAPRVGRGLATADLDDDGDLDLVFTTLGGAPKIFENRGGERRAWLRVRLSGTKRDATAIGARVVVEAGGARQVGEVKSGGSYLSQSDLRLHFGLADAARVDRVEVRWPDGSLVEARDVAPRREIVFVEGQGAR